MGLFSFRHSQNMDPDFIDGDSTVFVCSCLTGLFEVLQEVAYKRGNKFLEITFRQLSSALKERQ